MVPPPTSTDSRPESQQRPSANQTSSEPEHQLRSGIELIVQAFEQRNREMQAELSHWKQVATTQRQQIVTFEAEAGQLAQKLEERDKALAELHQEKRQLLGSKSALIDKYNVLRKSAMQLETFRKQLASMLELNTPRNVIPDHDTSFVDATGGADIYNAASTIIDQIETSSFRASRNKQSQNQKQVISDQTLEAELETLHLTPFANVDFADEQQDVGARSFRKSHQQQQQEPKNDIVLNRKNTLNSAAADRSMEAPVLYKQIRSLLTPTQFDEFATTIGSFNAGTMSAEATTRAMVKLIPNEQLVAQMKRLVNKAVDESTEPTSQSKRPANQVK